jgi:hypothetical protein
MTQQVYTDLEVQGKSKLMTFGDALEQLRFGHKMTRLGWNGNGIFIKLQLPTVESKMTTPYIYIDTTGLATKNPDAPKVRVPWIASQTDLLSTDWIPYGD